MVLGEFGLSATGITACSHAAVASLTPPNRACSLTKAAGCRPQPLRGCKGRFARAGPLQPHARWSFQPGWDRFQDLLANPEFKEKVSEALAAVWLPPANGTVFRVDAWPITRANTSKPRRSC